MRCSLGIAGSPLASVPVPQRLFNYARTRLSSSPRRIISLKCCCVEWQEEILKAGKKKKTSKNITNSLQPNMDQCSASQPCCPQTQIDQILLSRQHVAIYIFPSLQQANAISIFLCSSFACLKSVVSAKIYGKKSFEVIYDLCNKELNAQIGWQKDLGRLICDVANTELYWRVIMLMLSFLFPHNVQQRGWQQQEQHQIRVDQ